MVSKTTIVKFNLNIQLNCLQSTKRYKKVYLLKIRQLKKNIGEVRKFFLNGWIREDFLREVEILKGKQQMLGKWESGHSRKMEHKYT